MKIIIGIEPGREDKLDRIAAALACYAADLSRDYTFAPMRGIKGEQEALGENLRDTIGIIQQVIDQLSGRRRELFVNLVNTCIEGTTIRRFT